MLQQGAQLVDVLGREEYAHDHLPGAINIPIKELAETPPGNSYADIVRDLFALDPAATDVVTRADVIVADEGGAR